MKLLAVGSIITILLESLVAPSLVAADSTDQVRTKFFQGTACPGVSPGDVMVKVGPICIDVYEASIWDSLTDGTQINASACTPNGNDCTAVFARSVANVIPTANITWFQAQQACANSGKRLLTNAEWQMAAAGTPDGSTSSCNTNSGAASHAAPTGSFGDCVSNHGIHDMVGNLTEWVADWVRCRQHVVPPCSTPTI